MRASDSFARARWRRAGSRYARFVLLLVLFLAGWGAVQAESATALGYEPAYPADFTHFDYVNPDAPRGGHLNLSGFGSFDSLNPFVLRGMSASGLNLLVFEPLMVRSWDEPFSLYGLLAEDMVLADDGLSVTFRLNAAARFSDGSPVTAGDVKYSFDTLVGDQAHPRYRHYWSDVAGAKVLDARHVRFDFHRSTPELHLIVAELPVFSKDWVQDADFGTLTRVAPVGSGPYLVDEVRYGRMISYRRNPDYWARDLPTRRGMFNFDRVTFKYYRDQTVALLLAVTLPLAAAALTMAGLSPLPIDATPLSFVASALPLTYAVFRTEVHQLVPAAYRIGERTVLEAVDHGVL
ncbi:MAG: ABC transporter substrate-binding protein, partial [Halothiobacillaceae bacterium]